MLKRALIIVLDSTEFITHYFRREGCSCRHMDYQSKPASNKSRCPSGNVQ